MRRLEDSGRRVYLVSGGFRQVIHPIAKILDIPLTNVFANRILFEVGASVAVEGKVEACLVACLVI